MSRHLRQAGFTLAEVAVALAIIATVIGLLVPLFLNLRMAEQARSTDKRLEGVMQAVAAFVQINGCVPCPSMPASVNTAGFGGVRGDAVSTPCTNSCAQAVGLVPFRSLGIPEPMARDGYGYWLTYAVDAAMARNVFGVVTPPTTPCTTADTTSLSYCKSANVRSKGLCQPFNAATAITVSLTGGATQTAAVLVMSHGANHRGAYRMLPQLSQRIPFPTGVPSCGVGTGPERCNAAGDVTKFINAVQSNDSVDPFDDRMLYLSRDALVTYLGGPACGSGA